MLITALILAKNEESLIGACIDSVSNLCDEILVIDNGSSDRTAAVSKERGAEVISDPSENFDLLRNAFHDKAQGEWIFAIDADERLSSGSAETIRRTLEQSPEDVWGYTVPKLNYAGRGQWSEGNYLELFRNRAEISYSQSSIHASLTPSIEAAGKQIRRLQTPVQHVDALVRNTAYKRTRYRELIRQNLENPELGNSDRYYLQCFLASECMYIGEWDDAERLLLSAKSLEASHRTMAYTYLSQLYFRRGEIKKSMDESRTVLENIKQSNKFAWFNLARCHLTLNQFEAAESKLHSFIEFFPESCAGYYNLSYLLWLKKDNNQDSLMSALVRNDYLSRPEIYEPRPKSIYQNESLVFEMEDEYLKVLQESIRKVIP